MRVKVYIPAALLLTLLVISIAPQARADSVQSREYQIKAAFLCNFVKFVDWPAGKLADANQPVTIGIIGKDPFGKAFESGAGKIFVKRFGSFEVLKKTSQNDKAAWEQKLADLKKCHLLFICDSEKSGFKEILDSLKNHPVLTVADTKGFIEAGGVINLLLEEQKVRFEVNVTAAKQHNIQIRSKLLRLAKRVVEEKRQEDVKD
jgi:hypothetical protein